MEKEQQEKKQWITPEVELISVQSGTAAGPEGVTVATDNGSAYGNGAHS